MARNIATVFLGPMEWYLKDIHQLDVLMIRSESLPSEIQIGGFTIFVGTDRENPGSKSDGFVPLSLERPLNKEEKTLLARVYKDDFDLFASLS